MPARFMKAPNIIVTGRKLTFSESSMRMNPHVFGPGETTLAVPPADGSAAPVARPARIRKSNKTEQRCRDILLARGYHPVLEQAITLRLDFPFTSYRPDLAYMKGTYLTLVECKAPHRFREKGIAKAALAAKTYPMFRFELFDWTATGWKESVLSP